MADAPSSTSNRPKAALGALRPFVPYALHYKGRIAAAMGALLVASAATLVLPIAVRRVVDHGFSEGSGYLVNAYFVALIGVVAALALASAPRYYFVVTLGERVVADLRADGCSPTLTRLDPAFFDASQSGELVSPPHRGRHASSSRPSGLSARSRCATSCCSPAPSRMMVVTSPKLSALVLIAIPVIVLPLVLVGPRACARRSRAAQDTLATPRPMRPRRSARCAPCRRSAPSGSRWPLRRRGRRTPIGAARPPSRRAPILTGIAIFLVFGERRRGAVVRRAGRDRRAHDGRHAIAVRALRGVRRRRAGRLTEVWSEISQAAGAAETPRRDSGRTPAIARAGEPASVARAAARRGRLRGRPLRLSGAPGGARALRACHVSGQRRARRSPSSGRRAPASRPCFSCCCASTTRRRARVLVDGVHSATRSRRDCARRLALVPQEPAIFARQRRRQYPLRPPGAAMAEVCAGPRAWPHADAFIRACPRATRRRSASAA